MANFRQGGVAMRGFLTRLGAGFRAAAAKKTRLVARETSRARGATLDLHRKNRAGKAKYFIGERRENCAGAKGHGGKNVQGYSLKIEKGDDDFSPATRERPANNVRGD